MAGVRIGVERFREAKRAFKPKETLIETAGAGAAGFGANKGYGKVNSDDFEQIAPKTKTGRAVSGGLITAAAKGARKAAKTKTGSRIISATGSPGGVGGMAGAKAAKGFAGPGRMQKY